MTHKLDDIAGSHITRVFDVDADLCNHIVDGIALLLADKVLVGVLDGSLVGFELALEIDARVGEGRVRKTKAKLCKR